MAQHQGKEGEEELGMGCAQSMSHPTSPQGKSLQMDRENTITEPERSTFLLLQVEARGQHRKAPLPCPKSAP